MPLLSRVVGQGGPRCRTGRRRSDRGDQLKCSVKVYGYATATTSEAWSKLHCSRPRGIRNTGYYEGQFAADSCSQNDHRNSRTRAKTRHHRVPNAMKRKDWPSLDCAHNPKIGGWVLQHRRPTLRESRASILHNLATSAYKMNQTAYVLDCTQLYRFPAETQASHGSH